MRDEEKKQGKDVGTFIQKKKVPVDSELYFKTNVIFRFQIEHPYGSLEGLVEVERPWDIYFSFVFFDENPFENN